MSTTTPTHRLELVEHGQQLTMAWKGRVSDARLQQWIEDYIDSLKIGGCNAHISLKLGYIPIPDKAQIVHQNSGDIVATWTAPAFMVF